MGTLYIVGTPIGNLGDFSPRAIEILKTVDFIAAEDTRVTLKLLNHFEIRNTLISYHEHNAAARGPELLERPLRGCPASATPAKDWGLSAMKMRWRLPQCPAPPPP